MKWLIGWALVLAIAALSQCKPADDYLEITDCGLGPVPKSKHITAIEREKRLVEERLRYQENLMRCCHER